MEWPYCDVTDFNSTLEDEIVIEYVPPNFDAHPYNSRWTSPRDGVETSLSLRLTQQWRIDAHTPMCNRKRTAYRKCGGRKISRA